ncbi:MAG: GNAT family N-acetyltransferase [Rickettsiales bacterium]|nr:MAG: GNAT family N-acetyltransferase [Rickettsiales bacterium]
MLKIEKYLLSYKSSWDEFILNAKNGHFMFYRDYMEYHSDRFKDHSLIFTYEGSIVALLPANIVDNVLYSHQGLTFGGLIFDKDMKSTLMIDIFSILIQYLKDLNIKKLVYKNIPYIYCTMPAQEDLYALFKFGAKLSRVDITSTIDLSTKIGFSGGRKDGIRKARNSKLKVVKSDNYTAFYQILEEVLTSKHQVKPTHTLREIELLAKTFPQYISLYNTVNQDNTVLAATLIFEMNHWVHVQYIASSEQGKKLGALDILFQELINTIYSDKKIFDFGTSTESQGKVLNRGLIAQKEGFGARAVVHNLYELDI